MSVGCLYSLIESFESAGLDPAEAISAATNFWHKTKEFAEDRRPPKKWFDACYARVKKGNPKYTDEQIRKTCGAIWHKRGVRKVMGKSEADKGLKTCISRKIPIIVREWKTKGKAINIKQITAIAASMCRKGTHKVVGKSEYSSDELIDISSKQHQVPRKGHIRRTKKGVTTVKPHTVKKKEPKWKQREFRTIKGRRFYKVGRGRYSGTEKAIRFEGQWIPRSQTHIEGTQIFVSEWFMPKLLEQKQKTEMEKIDKWIEEEKQEIEKFKAKIANPPEFTSLTVEDWKKKIESSKVSIEKLKKRKELLIKG